jgi:hypothetical protein
MSGKLKLPYATTANRLASTPLQRELLYDIEEDVIYYGDGATVGGVKLAATVTVPFGGFIEVNANRTYPLFTPDRSYKIVSLRVNSGAGTCTWAVQIAGVNVTGLNAVSVSSTPQVVNATAANIISANQRVTIVSSDNNAALDVEFTLMLEAV